MRQKIANIVDKVYLTCGVFLVIYLISTTIVLYQGVVQHYTTFVFSIFLLIFLFTIRTILKEDTKGIRFWFRLGFFGLACIVALFVGVYMRVQAVHLNMVQPFFNKQEIFVGWLMLGSLLILTRFHWGTIMTGMVALAIIYFFLGHLIPIDMLKHGEFSTDFVMSYMGLDIVSGIFWFVPLAADKVFFLIIYAAMLLGIGMLPLLIEVGKLVGKRIRGGAAFPAIIGSAMTGMVMGQAVSNTMLTGQLTIPMMKKHGVKPEFAGAIEAVASSAGQLLPPILGLAAFIIATLLSMPYIEVALAATLPALLFVGSLVISVLVAARAYNLDTLNEEVDVGMILRLSPTFVISFGLVLTLLLLYYSPNIAALSGLVVMLIVSFFQGKKYMPSLKILTENFRKGLNIVTSLCLLLLAIGPLAQMATTTDLASKLSHVLSVVLPHNVPIILVGAMIISLILGMGLPTAVAYLLVALTVAPFLQELGVQPFVAHMFGLYFAVFSTVSPTVAISCLVASKISGASFLKTCLESIKLSLPTFIIPFAFAANPELLAFPNLSWQQGFIFILVVGTQFYVSISVFGYLFRRLTWLERSVFGVVSLLGLLYLMLHSLALLVAFVVLGLSSTLWLKNSLKRADLAAQSEKICHETANIGSRPIQ